MSICNPSGNAAQIEHWNQAAGQTWVELQAELDDQIAGLGERALAELAPTAGERILDVGCGCGQTTLELAHRVGASGQVIGVDVSLPMLSVARARAARLGLSNLDLRLLDAQEENLADLDVDAAYSRFGVMFFAEPVKAFQNLRSALRVGGRISFVCWRELRENAWMRDPIDAARPLLPPQPTIDPLAPGPYALANRIRTNAILKDAGFDAISIEPYDALVGGHSLESAVRLSLRVGPLGSVLREHQELVPAVRQAVSSAVARYQTAQGIRMPAAVWVVSARRAIA